ncbi:MAG: lipoyl(octanoyl) transferase LipB [Thermodesulfobacteriota bacterium]|nr:lipoyl(octanoyl) transferase LipB [Thermodesulfobacteriota bacterium]
MGLTSAIYPDCRPDPVAITKKVIEMNLKGIEFIDLKLTDYKKAFDFQKKIVSEKIDKTRDKDIILLLEHPAVFTLGKRGGRENLVKSEEFLKSKNIPIVQTERGGNITFHGPGQIVVYPIIDLNRAKIGVADFVYFLENIMIATALDFNVKAVRDKRNHGIWVKENKIGSVGLSIKRGISFHGLALNVNLDLEPFSWINPCGMPGIFMTSLAKEIKKNSAETIVQISEVKKKMIAYFKQLENMKTI